MKGTRRRFTDEFKDTVVKQYENCEKSVEQICSEHNIKKRMVYHWLEQKGVTFRRFNYNVGHDGTSKKNHKMMYLSKDEIEFILLMILETDGMFKGHNATISKVLEAKMLDASDCLTTK